MNKIWVFVIIAIVLIVALVIFFVVALTFDILKECRYTWVDFAMYIFVIILFFGVLLMEIYMGAIPENGTATANRASPSDSCQVMVEKTHNLANDIIFMVRWRMALILSFVAAIFIWCFVMVQIPQWQYFYLTVIIIFLVIYGFFSFYSYHLGGQAAGFIDDNLHLIEQKCVRP